MLRALEDVLGAQVAAGRAGARPGAPLADALAEALWDAGCAAKCAAEQLAARQHPPLLFAARERLAALGARGLALARGVQRHMERQPGHRAASLLDLLAEPLAARPARLARELRALARAAAAQAGTRAGAGGAAALERLVARARANGRALEAARAGQAQALAAAAQARAVLGGMRYADDLRGGAYREAVAQCAARCRLRGRPERLYHLLLVQGAAPRGAPAGARWLDGQCELILYTLRGGAGTDAGAGGGVAGGEAAEAGGECHVRVDMSKVVCVHGLAPPGADAGQGAGGFEFLVEVVDDLSPAPPAPPSPAQAAGAGAPRERSGPPRGTLPTVDPSRAAPREGGGKGGGGGGDGDGTEEREEGWASAGADGPRAAEGAGAAAGGERRGGVPVEPLVLLPPPPASVAWLVAPSPAAQDALSLRRLVACAREMLHRAPAPTPEPAATE